MNERIKELAEQSKIEFTYDPTETPMKVFVECWDDELGKFAELIVRECVKVAMRSVSDDEPKEAWYLIQEHFGVEE
jgi:hypothetical protein